VLDNIERYDEIEALGHEDLAKLPDIVLHDHIRDIRFDMLEIWLVDVYADANLGWDMCQRLKCKN
jgi:hypothetical protein